MVCRSQRYKSRYCEGYSGEIRGHAGEVRGWWCMYFLSHLFHCSLPPLLFPYSLALENKGNRERKNFDGKKFRLTHEMAYQIIGGPPKLQDNNGGGKWTKPSLVLSGPHHLDERLGETLNMTYVGDAIGKASGLKCCFAATSKGLIAIAIQSFTTAKRMGVLEELREHLGGFSPGIKGVVERGVGGMP